MIRLTVSVIGLFLFVSSFAQTYTSEDIRFTDGIYLSVEDFLTDKPSLELVPNFATNKYNLKELYCTNNLDYAKNGQIDIIKAKEVWGFAKEGVPFVKHKTNLITKKTCFARLTSIGALSIYYAEEPVINEFTHPDGLNRPEYLPAKSITKQKEFNEFVVDTATGEIYHSKNDAAKILKIIESHPKFSDEKLKKSDVLIHIYQYNESVPINFH